MLRSTAVDAPAHENRSPSWQRSQAYLVFFLLAALVPTVLMTVLIYSTVSDITQEQQHQKLTDASHAYAMNVFERLVLAETILRRIGAGNGSALKAERNENGFTPVMFRSLTTMTAGGRILEHIGITVPASALSAVVSHMARQDDRSKASIHVSPSRERGSAPIIALAIQQTVLNHRNAFLLAEINPDYLWGNREYIPDEI